MDRFRKDNKLLYNGIFWSVFVIMIVGFIILGAGNIYKNRMGLFGEADSYMLPTISIMNHGTMIITEEDINQAAEDFPEVYPYIKARYDAGRMIETKDREGVNPYYFCTYSLACLPLKIAFKIVGLPQSQSFAYTNLLMLITLCIYVAYKLKKSNIQRFLVILFIIFNPVFSYIPWQSAEVFIFCLVTLSILFFINKEYKRAAFSISLAGTLNITVMAFGFFMIFDYLLHLVKKYDISNLIVIIKKEALNIVKYGSCYLIVFLPFIHNWIYVGESNSTFVMFDLNGVITRWLAYFFDCNFGIFIYFPFLAICLLIVVIYAIKTRDYECLLLLLSMITVVFSYSLAFHINCGMTGISRYGAWTTPFLIILCVMYFPYRSFYKIVVLCLTILTVMYSMVSIYLSKYTTYMQMSVVAQAILDYVPQLYNPLFSTFNSRVNHIDGGYDYSERLPIIYCRSQDGIVKKILVNNENVEALEEMLEGDKESLAYVTKEISEHKAANNSFYINIPERYQIRVSDNNHLELVEKEEILESYPRQNQNDSVLFSSEIELKNDTFYKVAIKYRLDGLSYSSTYCDFFGGSSYDSSEQEAELKVCFSSGNEYWASCVLFSGDTSIANRGIVFRVLNMYSLGKKMELEEIHIYELQ